MAYSAKGLDFALLLFILFLRNGHRSKDLIAYFVLADEFCVSASVHDLLTRSTLLFSLVAA